jgi:hypothetical protein
MKRLPLFLSLFLALSLVLSACGGEPQPSRHPHLPSRPPRKSRLPPNPPRLLHRRF